MRGKDASKGPFISPDCAPRNFWQNGVVCVGLGLVFCNENGKFLECSSSLGDSDLVLHRNEVGFQAFTLCMHRQKIQQIVRPSVWHEIVGEAKF